MEHCRFVSIFAAIIISVLYTSILYAENMEQAIERAITTNPEVLEQLNQTLSRKSEIREAEAGFYPRIDITAGYGTETSDNNSTRSTNFGHSRSMNRQEGDIILRQMLFDGFETSSETARHEFRTESANFQLLNLSQEVAIDAIAAYINVIRTQKLVEYAEENVKIHERMHDQVELRSSMGADNQGSLSQIVGRLNLAYANLEAEKNNLKDALTEYEKVIGGKPETALEEAYFKLDFPKNYQEALDKALINHPAILAAQADINAVKMQKKTSKSNFYPDLELELGGEWSDNQSGVRGHDNAHYALLNFRYNIYQGGADQARIKKDVYLIQEAQKRLDVTRRKVVKLVEVAWNAYESSTRRADFLQKYVDATIKTSDAYEKQFRIGERTLLDLLNTENEIFSARSENLKNKFELILSKFRVIDSMGILLRELQFTVVSEK